MSQIKNRQVNSKINILASGHSDGRFGAIVGQYFKLNNIPTSSNEKPISLKPIFKLLKNSNYIGITPDGPRGPKQKVSQGIIKIAMKTQKPIIPIGFWSTNNFTLKSWDSFLITLPFSNCKFVWGNPIMVPHNLKNDQIIQVFEQNEEHFEREVIDYDDQVYLYWQKENVVLLDR